MKRADLGKYLVFYTLLFGLAGSIIFSFFLKEVKSFVYALYGDGHICFNSLVYYGEWLREIIRNLVQNHTLQIPMWDFSIGYGSDILTTFNWMTLGDPLNLLAVFFTPEKTEYLYGFLAIFRIYLCGFTFSIYARSHHHEKMPVLMGSLIYAFCGFSLFAGVRDVYFMSPMIYLPLLLLGVDRIFEKKKPSLFMVLVGLAAITNFYYFYMLSIWVFIYGIYRYFVLFGKKGLSFRKIVTLFMQCMLYYGVGVLMAAFLLLPIAMQLFSSERFANQDYVPLLYSFEYYWKLLVRFTSSESMEAWTHLGYAPITVIAIVILYLKKEKKYLAYKIGFAMCILFLMIPLVGSLMNAGSYVVNRWVWALSMLVAYLFVIIYPELFRLTKKEKVIVSLLCIGYALFCCIRGTYRTKQMMSMQVILLISLVVIIFVASGSYFQNKKTMQQGMILTCVLIGIVANGCFRFAGFGSNYVAGFVDAGQAWSLIHETLPSRALENQEDHDVVRYDSIGSIEPMYNTAMNHNLNSTNFYFSLADGQITRYFDDLWVNVEMEHRYKGLDERSILEHLAAVRYCIVGKESEAFIPYGYDTVLKTEDTYTIYENINSLPLGYTYDGIISEDTYEGLNGIRKQQALLQAALVEESDLPEENISFSEQSVPLTLMAVEGIEVYDDRIVVTDTNSTLKVDIEQQADTETYISFQGINYEKGEMTDQEEAHIVFTKDESLKKLVVYSKKHAFYHGREEFLVHMGYRKEDGSAEIGMQFTRPGTYYYSEINIVSQPMQMLEEEIAQRKESVLQEIVIEGNQISGLIQSDKNKILCMAIPYSKGWSATVNGVKTPIKPVNGMYLGIEIGSGEALVQFNYVTPYVGIGLLLSVIGLVCFVGIHLRQKRV